MLRSSEWSVSSASRPKILYAFISPMRATCFVHHILLDLLLLINIWWRVQIMILFIAQFSSASCHSWTSCPAGMYFSFSTSKLTGQAKKVTPMLGTKTETGV
jgi:hypothetical protein